MTTQIVTTESTAMTEQISSQTRALWIIAIAVILLGLVYGASFLIPIVIAFLLANLFEAMVERLEGIGLPTVLSYLVSTAIAAGAIALIVIIIAGQTDAVRQALPRYQSRLETIIADVLAWMGPTVTGRITQGIQEIDLASRAGAILGSAGNTLMTTLLVLLYFGFLLAERGRFTGKLMSIAGQDANEQARVADVLRGVSGSIRQYLWIKTLMSVLTGLVSYVVLSALGIDFAEMWALAIFFLNYIPSIGSVLGVLFPALVALVQFDTLWQFVVIACLLSTFQLLIGNVLEPLFMGRSLNLSPFVVIVALIFWSIIWGIPGAFLSVPITVAIMIICAHIREWRWMAVLLSANGAPDVVHGPESKQHG